MIKCFYEIILALAAQKSASRWLALISFAEASVFPLPPDMLLIPMVLATPNRGWWLALICTCASVAGGALGYAIGLEAFDHFAWPLLRAYGYQDAFFAFRDRFAQAGVWIILLKGLTPIPYKIVTLASGAAHFDFGLFMGASLLTRGARFFLLAGLLRRFGAPIRHFIEQRLGAICLAVAIAIILGFVFVRTL